MAKPQFITLGQRLDIPILYEDRSVLAVDKPVGWILAPSSWDRTGRNLQLAITSSIRGGDFWARSRGLKFLRFVHRLDAETTGVLLFAKSAGGVTSYSRLFETRNVIKTYYAVVEGTPAKGEWVSQAPIGPDLHKAGKMRVDKNGKPAETRFAVEKQGKNCSLVRAMPITGRTHQIRIHLFDSGLRIIGDALYGSLKKSPAPEFPFALRSASLEYADVFSKRSVLIEAPMKQFFTSFGF